MTALSSLLIANRGEIAVRIARTARAMGITTVAVHSDVDATSPHVAACDRAVAIGGAAPAESYLVADRLIAAARESGAQAIHPGYGFLSENAGFAAKVAEAGLIFVGPPAAAIAAMGDKARARRRMADAGIPVVPGYDDEDQTPATLIAAAERIGFPIMVKASAGGGGRGMRLVHQAEGLPDALRLAASEAAKAFGDGRLILERAVIEPRHVEVQVFADSHGNVIHLGERDCSVQRRHQKVIEEAPSPAVDAGLRAQMGEAAVAVARAIGYAGAGTVEFLLDRDGQFYFMEMNTRLQVEHPVTELVTGLDLVEWQLRVARGERLPLTQDQVRLDGHAVEVRLCAEDPADDFLPRTGPVLAWRPPSTVRCDHGLAEGVAVSPHYDSMLGKVIAHGADRGEAIDRLARALDDTVLLGLTTNRGFLARLLRHPAFVEGSAVSTAFIARHFPDDAARRETPDNAVWALAAWLSVLGTAEALSCDPAWRGWSNATPLPSPWRLVWGDDERRGVFDAGAGTVTIRVGEAGITVAPGRPGEAVVAGVRRRYAHAWDGERLWLTVDGRDFDFLSLRRQGRTAAGAGGAADGVLRAPMNGRVVRVEVAEGAEVAIGQALVTLEAMKMEHLLVAATAGRVKTVAVTVGDQVAPGQILIEVEPANS
ncbi:MAG: ATP-grasp domain-containing protein [Alphaproteobacteria bacterium]|jgi:geranyl-CoA carboxylase alpha subunit|nr:ATP-grasp domain-containing protein [Alphaproteobacteria bacterium]